MVNSMTQVATEVLAPTVDLACRAPSYHNSQPWRWVADCEGLQLFLDPTRVVETDRHQRQALMSFGAVVCHLRVARPVHGWQAHIDFLPDDDPEHLASAPLAELAAVTDEQR